MSDVQFLGEVTIELADGSKLVIEMAKVVSRVQEALVRKSFVREISVQQSGAVSTLKKAAIDAKEKEPKADVLKKAASEAARECLESWYAGKMHTAERGMDPVDRELRLMATTILTEVIGSERAKTFTATRGTNAQNLSAPLVFVFAQTLRATPGIDELKALAVAEANTTAQDSARQSAESIVKMREGFLAPAPATEEAAD